MIRLESVTKQFPGTARAAVDALDLEVPHGATCVLIGPSGCGKTTTLRMINRLIDPTSGRIFVEGEDVTHADPVLLRRRVGYVIQSVGLFPHQSVAENIATVPRLLGWPQARIAARVEEMLALVGLDSLFLKRFPRQLSGGQRQRVGVARALAADPPVMLMDEPFGAVDPLVRSRLQAEFLEILRRVKKTVVLVTHDINEAIRMGDLVAIVRDGRLAQLDAPERLLARPADAFVADFVGTDRILKRLALLSVTEAALPGMPAAGAPEIAGSASLREALVLLLGSGTDEAAVRDGSGAVAGRISFAAIRARAGDQSVAAASRSST